MPVGRPSFAEELTAMGKGIEETAQKKVQEKRVIASKNKEVVIKKSVYLTLLEEKEIQEIGEIVGVKKFTEIMRVIIKNGIKSIKDKN